MTLVKGIYSLITAPYNQKIFGTFFFTKVFFLPPCCNRVALSLMQNYLNPLQ